VVNKDIRKAQRRHWSQRSVGFKLTH